MLIHAIQCGSEEALQPLKADRHGHQSDDQEHLTPRNASRTIPVKDKHCSCQESAQHNQRHQSPIKLLQGAAPRNGGLKDLVVTTRTCQLACDCPTEAGIKDIEQRLHRRRKADQPKCLRPEPVQEDRHGQQIGHTGIQPGQKAGGQMPLMANLGCTLHLRGLPSGKSHHGRFREQAGPGLLVATECLTPGSGVMRATC
jgi:hypothetical protein